MRIQDVTKTVKIGVRLRATFDFRDDVGLQVRLTAPTPEAREEALARLTNGLPVLELLEAALRKPSESESEQK
jgi:adenine C2-methylase RlmN of 23S rRNA A2503 and tRNA A37